MNGPGELTRLSTASIRENETALREVDKESEEYQELVASIASNGLFSAITVRERFLDEEGNFLPIGESSDDSVYELIDGRHRLLACRDAGLEEIPAIILDLDDAETYSAQIIANVHKVNTKPAQYSKQLKRILAINPLLTEAELATKIGKSSKWLRDRLSLNKITNSAILSAIDDGTIPLSNAFSLAKLPEDEQPNWIDRAVTDPPSKFVPECNARIKEVKEAERKGKAAEAEVFKPVAHMRKMGEVKEELDALTTGPAILKSEGITDPIQAWEMCVKWFLNLDPQSVKKQEADWAEKKRRREEAAAKRKRDAADKKAEKAKEKAAEAAAEAKAVREEVTA